MFWKRVFKEPVKEVFDSIGGIIDDSTLSKEERAEIKAKLEQEITSRWDSDNKAGWLTRNIRPLTLGWCILNFTLLMWFDGNFYEFQVQKDWIPMFTNILITVVGGYFVVRTIDKRGKSR